MADSNQIKETGISVNTEDTQEKNNTEKPQYDGGNSGGEKKEQSAEKKSRLNEEIKSTLLFAATSIIAGCISFVLTPAKPNFISLPFLAAVLVIMIAIFAATKAIVQKLVGKKNTQWIMGNGGAIYLFLWFVSWIIFYNAL